jgi:hypothetical protein
MASDPQSQFIKDDPVLPNDVLLYIHPPRRNIVTFLEIYDRLNLLLPKALEAIRESELTFEERRSLRMKLWVMQENAHHVHDIEALCAECQRLIDTYTAKP